LCQKNPDAAVIDNTFNANPQHVLEALYYLKVNNDHHYNFENSLKNANACLSGKLSFADLSQFESQQAWNSTRAANSSQ
jgi:hypothetical protein